MVALLRERDVQRLWAEPGFYGPFRIEPAVPPEYSVGFADFQCEKGAALFLRNLTLGNVRLNGSGDFIITDCLMWSLSADGGCRVELAGSWVVDFEIGDLRELKMSGGGVYRPSFLPSEAKHPDAPYDITRDVAFPVQVPNGTVIGDGLPFGHPQPIRTMLRHMRKRGDPEAVRRFEVMVRERERRLAPPASRAIGWLYRVVAGYGTSWGRPLLWWFALVLATGAVLGWTDGARLAGNYEELPGWPTGILSDNPCAPWWRGLWLAAQSFVNPLGKAFEAQVVPAGKSAAALVAADTLGSWLLIYLAVAGAKRQFGNPTGGEEERRS